MLETLASTFVLAIGYTFVKYLQNKFSVKSTIPEEYQYYADQYKRKK